MELNRIGEPFPDTGQTGSDQSPAHTVSHPAGPEVSKKNENIIL
jgi:hypothetical protein